METPLASPRLWDDPCAAPLTPKHGSALRFLRKRLILLFCKGLLGQGQRPLHIRRFPPPSALPVFGCPPPTVTVYCPLGHNRLARFGHHAHIARLQLEAHCRGRARLQMHALESPQRPQRRARAQPGRSDRAAPLRRPRACPCWSQSLPPAAVIARLHCAVGNRQSAIGERSCSSAHIRTDTAAFPQSTGRSAPSCA